MGKPLITSVRSATGPSHDHVSIWNRGALAGHLTVAHGDGIKLATLLLPEAVEGWNIGGDYTRTAIEVHREAPAATAATDG